MKPKIEIGQRVRWATNFEEYGTVIDLDYANVKVKWDDGIVSIYSLKPQTEGSIEKLHFIKGGRLR